MEGRPHLRLGMRNVRVHGRTRNDNRRHQTVPYDVREAATGVVSEGRVISSSEE